jgi:hypothetical protein
MKAPANRLGQFLFFFLVEFISTLIIVANERAFVQGSYGWTAATELLWGAQSFVMWKLMIDDTNGRSWSSGAGMVIGATAGAEISILLTKILYGR